MASCARMCCYPVIKGTMMLALNMYFSNGVEVVNQDNIPKEGPLIIVGNHMSQFVDAIVMLKTAGRKVSFIVAEKSMHRAIIGDVARVMNAVPVIRPQDKAVPGSGQVVQIDEDSCIVTIENGDLAKDFAQAGCSIAVKGVGTMPVLEIVSDSELRVKFDESSPPNLEGLQGPANFKVVPKIPQKEMFQEVYRRLEKGDCIGIFPEGGSHDNTDLLPLKAGVSVMALGAAAQGIPVKVVAIGINYFHGHTFRSNAFVDCSVPFEIDDALVELYKTDRKTAGTLLLERVQTSLKSVVFNAPNYNVLKAMRTARRMYSHNVKLNSKQFMKLNERFSQGYQIWKKDPEMRKLLHDIHVYLKFAASQGLTDKQVRDLRPLGSCSTWIYAWFEIAKTILLLLLVTPLILPGLILSAPVPLRTRCVVKREMKKALAGSSVKVAARDVAASQKIIQGAVLIPTLLLLYTGIILLALYLSWPYQDQDSGEWHEFVVENAWWLIPIVFLFVFPFYVFYFCVVMAESIWRRLRHFPSWLISVTSLLQGRSSSNPAEMLREDRKRLVLRVQQYVEEHIGLVDGWAEDRVIQPEEITKRRSLNTKKLWESGDLAPSIMTGDSTQLSFADDLLDYGEDEEDFDQKP